MADPTRSGTQSIDRSVMLLKRLAMRGRTGWGLTDLAARCDLDKSTTHRILSALIRGRIVERDAASRRYRLGPMLFELSLARPDSLAIQKACEAPLQRLATRLRCLTYVYLRSDCDAVVAARAGSLPIKAMAAQIGTRRLLVETAGGTAILMAMEKPQADAIIAASLRELEEVRGASHVRSVRRILEQSRKHGYGISEGHIAPNTTAIGVPIFDAAGNPFAAINAGGPAEYFPAERLAQIAELLREEARAIERAAARIAAKLDDIAEVG